MLLSDRIMGNLTVALLHVIVFSLCLMVSSCKESSNASSNKDMIISETTHSQSANDKTTPTLDMKAQDGNLKNEQFQDNPPEASRPRFPIPKPTPIPAPVQGSGSEGGAQ